MRFASLTLTLSFLACSSTTVGTGAPDGGTDDGTGTGTVHNDLVVFTTKASLQGDLGGLAGADAKCNTYASAAGLSGKFRAWLSDSDTDAISRVPEGGPWRVLDKNGKQSEVAFADRAGWEGYPKVAIVNTEFGKTLSELSTSSTTEIPYTWTGTQLGGKKLGCHCADWTSSANPSVGCTGNEYGGVIGSRSASKNDEGWTNFAPNPCDTRSALLCYQLP